MSDEIKQAIRLLAEEIADNQCILFLGNDLPLGYPRSAPPCREELAKALAADLIPPPQGQPGLATVAQAYQKQRSRNDLVRRLRELVDKPGYKPAWLHRLAAELPVKGYVITAYDSLLEQALRERGRSAISIVDDPETSSEGTADASIVKLHGEARRPGSLVLSETDYWELPAQVELKLQKVKDYFNTKTILIAGYKLDDESFKQLYFAVKNRIGKFGRELYAVYPKCPPDTRNFWADQEMKILDAEPQQFLTDLLAAVEAIKQAPAAPEEFRLSGRPPYKYLDSYTADDQEIFFGRDTDALLVWGKVLSFRTTMLFGASGTGKTSLLQAGVAPRLKRVGYDTALVRLLDDPVEAVMKAVQKARGQQISGLPLHLVDFFQSLPPDERWVVCLDQFEEFFVHQPPDGRARFRAEVAACTAAQERDVRFVFSVREDFVGQMQELRAAMPDLWINSHRLMPLSRSEAAQAIAAPAARAGLHYEPGLVEHELLKELGEGDSVAPPNLQIVCQELYKEVLSQSQEEAQALVAAWQKAHPDLDLRYPVCHAVARAQYRDLGGAHEILRVYLDRALNSLAPGEGSQAREQLRDLFRALVNWQDTAHTKAVLTAEEAAARADAPPAEAAALLKRLAGKDYRLVRSLNEGQQYELAHECLIQAIQAWPESPQRTRARDIKNMLAEHRKMGELLSQKLLERVWDERDNPRLKLSATELELLLRSALAAGCEAGYWFERACQGGVAADAIALEGLKSDSFRTRAAAAAALGELGEQFAEAIIPLLADDYAQVRAAAIAALERLRPGGEWRAHLKCECYVPAGEFLMGEEDEAHPVTLAAFYAGKYPVTNAEYKRYMDDVKQPFDIPPGKADHPVVEVSWYHARNYAAWAGMRLLTEAEWEKAASWEPGTPRGGGAGEQGGLGRLVSRLVRGEGAALPGKKLTYPWGDEFDKSRCNTSESDIGGTTPLGKYGSRGDSPYGCADMAGNVLEWTSSLYKEYPYKADDGREDPHSGDSRVLRGGSFNLGVRTARAASRSYYDPSNRSGYRGFRVGWSSPSSPRSGL